jgi:hypothetical protein
MGGRYFLSIWNLFDIFPIIAISVILIMYYRTPERWENEPNFLALSSLIMWSKALNFFRIS